MSVFQRHQVVQDGIDGGGEVIEEPADVVQVLVDRPEEVRVFEVDVGEALSVERGPTEEEGQNHGG